MNSTDVRKISVSQDKHFINVFFIRCSRYKFLIFIITSIHLKIIIFAINLNVNLNKL